jgi:hypothetical protein
MFLKDVTNRNEQWQFWDTFTFVTLADIDNQKQTVPILICMIPFIGPCRYFPTLSWQIDEDS